MELFENFKSLYKKNETIYVIQIISTSLAANLLTRLNPFGFDLAGALFFLSVIILTFCHIYVEQTKERVIKYDQNHLKNSTDPESKYESRKKTDTYFEVTLKTLKIFIFIFTLTGLLFFVWGLIENKKLCAENYTLKKTIKELPSQISKIDSTYNLILKRKNDSICTQIDSTYNQILGRLKYLEKKLKQKK